jgi:GDPmannose 4,6-dehydratase
LQDKLILGNLDAKRDFGYSPDYVKAMWLILQQNKPDDFIIATNETHTIREFVELVFRKLDIDLSHIQISSDFYRPNEVNILQGDYSKAEKTLGWKPEIKFNKLIDIMIEEELKNSE